jgi:hypothetical protein
MNFDAAFVKKSGVEIGIIATTTDILNDKMQADNLIKVLRRTNSCRISSSLDSPG